MKHRLLILTLFLAVLFVPRASAQDAPEFQDPEREKLGQTGMKFLSVSLDPHAAAMGNALTAVDLQSSVAMLYNPAGMAHMPYRVHAAAMNTQWIADIQYNGGTVAFSPMDGRYGVFGLSLVTVDYGDFIGTVRDETSASGYRDIGNYSPSALAVGFGYAKALTDRFSVGGNVKYVNQDLGDFPVSVAESGSGFLSESYSKSVVALDFGVLYRTGFRSLNFAMSARNFARELQYEEENFELPLTFEIGVSMNVLDLTTVNPEVHAFRVAVDAVRPRDFKEHINIGGEYVLMDLLSLRAGYSFPADEQGVSLGAGLHRDFESFGFAVNYAYTSFGIFDIVNRLGVQFSF